MIDFIEISPKRHLLKTISYRIVSSVIGFLVLWFLFGLSVAITFSLFEVLWKPLQYYFHDRIWYQYVKCGVTKVDTPVKPEVRIVESISTASEDVVTTTSPKRLVYTKKTE
jgi:uncharacterized membrane protein